MPSVYSSVFQSFIRQGFSKSFTHGYAQSVVAATHPHALNSQNRPSFARRRNSTRIGRISTIGLQSAFHTSSTVQTHGSLEQRQEKLAANHGGLDAYFEQLQKSQANEEEEADKEWVQFQFPKRIEWKPTPASILVGSDAKTLALESEELASQDATTTASGVPPEAMEALAHIDAAIEREIEVRRELEALEEEVESLRATSPALAEQLAEEIRSRSRTPKSAIETPVSVARTVTPPIDPQSQTYADHLTKLSADGRYAEIPAVFEAMLVGGITPIATAYNALLMAAIHLPFEKWEIVTKALDVYADMLRRKVSPDSDTYNILVGLLASRSLEISSLKQVLEDKRLRFGGMDEPGKFMFASHELEHAMLVEDDRLDLAMRLFEGSVTSNKALYSSETYHQLIAACAQAGRVEDMLKLFEHMESNQTTPFAATFPAMITAFANAGDLVSAVECFNEYRNLAIANDKGELTLQDRLDAQVYAAVINAYVISDKLEGAMRFYSKIVQEYGAKASEINGAIIAGGFVKGFIDRGIYQKALSWALQIEKEAQDKALGELATIAADHGDGRTAVSAFKRVPSDRITTPAIALLAMSIRQGDVASASQYWSMLSAPTVTPTADLIEPTAMYAVALIGSGQVREGLDQAEAMFQRIRESAVDAKSQLAGEIEEGSDFISKFMAVRGISRPSPVEVEMHTPVAVTPYPPTPAPQFDDTFDPYAHSLDFKGSTLISEDLDTGRTGKGPKLNDALNRLRNIRRVGRHPRYITYAKLIAVAGKEGKIDLCRQILAMARADVPPLPQHSVVRYGWSSIMDSMIGACLQAGLRSEAEQYHEELLSMGATPSANTYGLYITTLKESSKTFDEASEAVKIFLRAKAEGVEPSSFLYNALIGKLGKARRIDDCLFYFAEMRALGIRPTSVTYGTVVNALCRVSDEKFAEELFEEMEAMPNYKARPAPYNSMMQFFLTTKRDKAKVLEYYERMKAEGIAPTAHTFKLLIDTHATLDPVDMPAAEAVLDMIRSYNQRPEPVHYASLIHARGCVLHDMAGARRVFDEVMADPKVAPNPIVYQALFESMVANHQVTDTEPVLAEMRKRRVPLTAYIANTLIHGWAAVRNIDKAKAIYGAVGVDKREPSTYDAMTRAFLAVQDRESANGVVSDMLSRGYPNAVVNKVLELLSGGQAAAAPVEGAAVVA